MLKHEEIISKLTDIQKVLMLTDLDFLKTKEMRALGIPAVKVGNIKNILRGTYPHKASLSHSWDTALWDEVARDKAAVMVRKGYTLAEVPGARIKLSPFRKEATEDPYFASVMSGRFQKATVEAGLYTALSACYVTESDTDFLDVKPNNRIIREYIAKPYIDSIAIGGAEGVISDSRSPSLAYKDINHILHSQILADDKALLSDNVSDEDTVGFIERGGICVKGSALALETALKRYQKLKKSVDSGDLPLSELESEIASHSAISTESVNRAVNRVLELAFHESDKNAAGALDKEKRKALAIRAALESTVLLKNQRSMLPISKHSRIAVIGDIGYSKETDTNPFVTRLCKNLGALGCKKVTSVRGYDFASPASNKFINEAIRVASSVETVILLLGFGDERERMIHKTSKLTLPANQLLLADSLSKQGKKVIAVMCASHAPDVAFSRAFPALLLAPPTGAVGCPRALAEIILGVANPSGRLAYTLYAGSDLGMAKALAYKKNYGVRQGPFIGYRYYDTAQMNVGYPFGHGLSYSEVEYSGLVAHRKSVTLKLENRSSRTVTETVQIYAGHCSPALIRPKKELCGFKRVELLPNQVRTVHVPISIPAVHDKESNKFIVEGGKYNIYVGASVSDIRLVTDIHVSCRDRIKREREALSDYLQTASNIIKDKFTLEADYKPMKKSIKNILSGIGALAVAISIGIFNSMTNLSSIFLSAIAAFVALAGVIFFILEIKERNNAHKLEKKRMAEKNAQHFSGAAEIDMPSADKLFRAEFDTEEEAQVVRETNTVTSTLDDEFLSHIIHDLTLPVAVADFEKFAIERGYKFDNGVVENMFASLASSRLIIVEKMSHEDLKNIMILFSEYFGTKTKLDKVTDEYKRDIDLFYSYKDGNQAERNIIAAMRGAGKGREFMHFIALDNVSCAKLSAYVNPLLRYLKNPSSDGRIIAKSESGTHTLYRIPGNLYFIFNVKDSVMLLPETVSKIASVISLSYTKVKELEEPSPFQKFKHYQMVYLAERFSARVPEEFWKKIDKLEAYAERISDYKIGNKLWLGIEKHIAALVAAGVESEVAIDRALATRLMPSLISSVTDKITEDDRPLNETLDVIFGEAGMALCRDVLKAMTPEQKTVAVESPEPQKHPDEMPEDEDTEKIVTDPTPTAEVSDKTEDEVSDETKEESTDIPVRTAEPDDKAEDEDVLADAAHVDSDLSEQIDADDEATEAADDETAESADGVAEAEAPAEGAQTEESPEEISPEEADSQEGNEIDGTETDEQAAEDTGDDVTDGSSDGEEESTADAGETVADAEDENDQSEHNDPEADKEQI